MRQPAANAAGLPAVRFRPATSPDSRASSSLHPREAARWPHLRAEARASRSPGALRSRPSSALRSKSVLIPEPVRVRTAPARGSEAPFNSRRRTTHTGDHSRHRPRSLASLNRKRAAASNTNGFSGASGSLALDRKMDRTHTRAMSRAKGDAWLRQQQLMHGKGQKMLSNRGRKCYV